MHWGYATESCHHLSTQSSSNLCWFHSSNDLFRCMQKYPRKVFAHVKRDFYVNLFILSYICRMCMRCINYVSNTIAIEHRKKNIAKHIKNRDGTSTCIDKIQSAESAHFFSTSPPAFDGVYVCSVFSCVNCARFEPPIFHLFTVYTYWVLLLMCYGAPPPEEQHTIATFVVSSFYLKRCGHMCDAQIKSVATLTITVRSCYILS